MFFACDIYEYIDWRRGALTTRKTTHLDLFGGNEEFDYKMVAEISVRVRLIKSTNYKLNYLNKWYIISMIV